MVLTTTHAGGFAVAVVVVVTVNFAEKMFKNYNIFIRIIFKH